MTEFLRNKRRGCQVLADDLIKGASSAAAHLGPHFTARAVYHMVEAHQLPVIRKGRTLYFRKSDLDQAFTLK